MKAEYLLLAFFHLFFFFLFISISRSPRTPNLIGTYICMYAAHSYFDIHSHNCVRTLSLSLSLTFYTYTFCGYILLRAHRSVSAISNGTEHLCKMFKCRIPNTHIFHLGFEYICVTVCVHNVACVHRNQCINVHLCVCVCACFILLVLYFAIDFDRRTIYLNINKCKFI